MILNGSNELLVHSIKPQEERNMSHRSCTIAACMKHCWAELLEESSLPVEEIGFKLVSEKKPIKVEFGSTIISLMKEVNESPSFENIRNKVSIEGNLVIVNEDLALGSASVQYLLAMALQNLRKKNKTKK
jgi:hypothetical protein